MLLFFFALQFATATRKSLERRFLNRITWIYNHLPAGSSPNAMAVRCHACKKTLSLAKKLVATPDGSSTVATALQSICDRVGLFAHAPFCRIPHNQAMTFAQRDIDDNKIDAYKQKNEFEKLRSKAITGLYNDATNVISIMDASGLDGDLFCHYLMLDSCPLPEQLVDNIDLSNWWPPKPATAVEPSSSGRTFRVLHLSDIHFQRGYTEGAEAECGNAMCCRKGTFPQLTRSSRPSMPAPPMGHYHCDTPEKLMHSSLNHITATGADITDNGSFKFAIFTGDIVDHDPLFVSYEESVQEEVETMMFLKRHLGDIPVYSVLGNHDTYPFAQIAQKTSGFSNLFEWNAKLMAEMWEEYDWLDAAAAQQVREHYGGFATTTSQGLRIISLNSNFWYIYNMYNYWDVASTDVQTGSLRPEDTSGVLRFLVDELLACEKRGQRAWIIAHVPPNGADTLSIPTVMLTQIVERFSPHIIAGLFFGHTHQDQFQLLYSGSTGTYLKKTAAQALGVAWIAPSITPLTDFNPGWRYYDVDAETFTIMDSHNFYARLNDTFDESLDYLDWEHLYSARTAYDFEKKWHKDWPLNATFWHAVAERIRADESGDFTQRFLNYGFRNSPYTPNCFENENCQMENYCFVSSFNPEQARKCMEEGKN